MRASLYWWVFRSRHVLLCAQTDCPYLGPEPGKRNDPRNIPLVVKKIAEIKKIGEEEVRKIILENAKTVFGL